MSNIEDLEKKLAANTRLASETAASQLHTKLLGGGYIQKTLLEEEFRRADRASAAVKESLSRIPDFHKPFGRNFDAHIPESELPEIRLPVPPPNPAYETNEHLEGLSENIRHLIDVAKEQAELTLAINESTKAALQYAEQVSLEAKASTELSRISMQIARYALVVAVISTILGVVIPLYTDHQGRASNDSRIQQENIAREQELKVLGKLSDQLDADAKDRSEAARALRNKTAPTKVIPQSKH